jgi:soluble lytic murein transglycosylase
MTLRAGNTLGGGGPLRARNIGRLLAAGACCAVVACSIARFASPGAPASPSLAQVVPTTEGAPEVQPAPAERLDLETFTPLLALPELREAREAVDAGDVEQAAELVRLALEQKTYRGVERARVQFLLARLEEEAGRPQRAAPAYAAAAQETWELTAYAHLGAGRAHLAAGDVEAAFAALERVPVEGPVGAGVRPLLAEAAERTGNLERAVRLWSAEVSASPSADAHRALARVLLARLKARPSTATEPAASGAPGEPLGGAAVEAEARAILLHAQAAEVGQPPSSDNARAARALQREAGTLLPGFDPAQPSARAPEVEVRHIEALHDGGHNEDALEATTALAARLDDKWSPVGCQLAFVRAKVLAQLKEWGKASDELAAAVQRCRDDAQLRPRLLFVAGKFAASDGRHAQAARYFEMLEQEAPDSTLADDSRLKRAQSYLRLGAEARFTELLSSMPADYPNGDMTMEGVLELALRRIERHDWSGATSVLERGAELVRGKDSVRGHEHSGRERYFLARARYETGRQAEALDQYADIVRELPLSYYMLHAYSRLHAVDPARAAASLEEGVRRAVEQPFSFAMRSEYRRPEFQRGMELLRVGDFARGRRELGALARGDGDSPDASLLWGIALLYGRAGAAGPSHGIARGQLTDWFAHWPSGDWRKPWEIGFPRPHHSVVTRESKKNSVPEWFIYAIMREESAFDPAAESPAKAYGLMQLIVPTAKIYAQRVGLPYQPQALKRPAVNIALGSRVLNSLTTKFSENPLLSIPAYNAGPGRPARWLRERPDVDFDVWVELIPFRETRRYTKRVLASRAAYAYLYDAEHAEEAMRLPLKLVAP